MSSPSPQAGQYTLAELATQPDSWRRAAATTAAELSLLPAAGEPVVVLGCGTSYYVGEAYARRRVAAGLGPTRAAIPSELDGVADDEVVILLSRSGKTGDLVAVAEELKDTHRLIAIAGEAGTPVPSLVPAATIVLDYADEHSVMQTRFATTGLALLRRSLDEDIEAIAQQGEQVLTAPLPIDDAELAALTHVVFLGHKWSAGLAQEAALKVREAAGFWTEAYPLFEYQHGPISCAGPTSLVWALTDVPESVALDIKATGAKLVVADVDAQAEMIRVHRLAVALAFREGRNPDSPPHLSRAVEVSEI